MAPTTTKDDQQVAAALEIRSISSSLKQFNNSLEEAIKILINPNDFSQAKKTRAAKELKELKAHLINSANQLAQMIQFQLLLTFMRKSQMHIWLCRT